MISKAGIREVARENLRQLPAEIKTAAAMVIRRKIGDFPAFLQATSIAFFHPTSTEPDLIGLMEAFPEKQWFFPLCHRDRSMTWHRPRGLADWKTSSFGISEPDPEHCPPVMEPEFDFVIVPGLAFTPAGDRLGHGAGYYDRFLATLPRGVFTAGVCFSQQLLGTLPIQGHDIAVDAVFHE